MAVTFSAAATELRRKFLRRTLWIITTRTVASEEEISTLLEAHLRNQVRLEKEGVMLGAGPLSHPDGQYAGLGMFIVRARDEAEARAIADSDPFHQAGMRTYTLQQWLLNEGRITITVDFSDQTYQFA